ncbi:MAG TPA: hypothetical protein VE549_01955 [Myxococcaceae bacterium]|nr:hypothetical protein [Myxococcaceae bacterium]
MREARRDPRGLLAAVAASVALHAAALFLICGAPPRPVEPPPQLVDFDFVVSAQPQLAPPSEPPKGGTKARRTDPVVPPAPIERSTAADEPSSTGSDAPLAKSEAPPVLVPSPSLAERLGAGAQPEESGSGQTIVNTPQERPDERAVAEYTAENLQRRLDADLKRDVAEVRTRNGLSPRYFTRVQEALRDAFGGAPVEVTKKSPVQEIAGAVIDAVETWRLPAEQFGRTGSPVTSPDQTRAVEESGLGRMMERNAYPSSDEGARRSMVQTLQQLATLDILAKSARRVRLRVIVALHHDWSGALADVRILESSKDPEFDAWVLHLTRRVFREHGERDHDSVDLPYEAEGWNSDWQFTYEPPRMRVKLLRAWPGPPPPRG